jgi:hypothetical protein
MVGVERNKGDKRINFVPTKLAKLMVQKAIIRKNRRTRTSQKYDKRLEKRGNI